MGRDTGDAEVGHRCAVSVKRGQRGGQTSCVTPETCVVWLITQRSRVQIPPPLPSPQVRGLFRSWKGPSACAVCTELCTRPLRAAAAWAGRGEVYPADAVRHAGGGRTSPEAQRPDICDELQMKCNSYYGIMSAQTLGFAIQPEDRPVLDELVAYFGDGNRSAYLRATLKVMKSIMIADQLRRR